MIPFWKKTGKHSKPQSAQKRRQNAKPAVPRTAQQSIPMQRMFEDGTCRVKANYYTRTIQYQDINYQLAQQEDKTAIFEEWCSFLNFFDSSIKFELSFVNMATDSTEFEKSIRIPYQKDGFDDVRAEYSQMLRQQLAKGNNGLTKTKFITFGVEGESMAQVKPRLDHIQNDLLNNFHRLGVQAKPLNGAQRLKLMHDMFNMDGASKFHFDWKDLVKSGLSVKDAIAPTAFAFKNSRTFQMGGIFCAASFLSITASDISDQLLKDFLDMDSSQIVTMHIQSVDQNKAIKTVKRTITEEICRHTLRLGRFHPGNWVRLQRLRLLGLQPERLQCGAHHRQRLVEQKPAYFRSRSKARRFGLFQRHLRHPRHEPHRDLSGQRHDGQRRRPHQVRKHSLVLLGEASRRVRTAFKMIGGVL